jgi:hypothetical protein
VRGLVPDADGITRSAVAGVLVASCPRLADIEAAADPRVDAGRSREADGVALTLLVSDSAARG